MYSQLEILEAVRDKFNYVEVKCQKENNLVIWINSRNIPFEIKIEVIEEDLLQFTSTIYSCFNKQEEICKIAVSNNLESQLNAIKSYFIVLSNQISKLIKEENN